MRVLCLDFPLSLNNVDHQRFHSATSVYEYDIVIWNPAVTHGEYFIQSKIENLPYFSGNESRHLQGTLGRRKEEFLEFLRLGRTLVVSSCPPLEVLIDAGEQEASGAEKDRFTLDIARSVIPLEYGTVASKGKSVAATKSDLMSIIRAHPALWGYDATFVKHPGEVLAFAEGTRKCVAFWARGPKDSGNIIFLPRFVPDYFSGDDRSNLPPLNSDEYSEAASKLLDWIKSFVDPVDEFLPTWARTYEFPEDSVRAEKVHELNELVKSTLGAIDAIKAEQAKADRWKLLFTAQGNTLEKQVREAFEFLGFQVCEGSPGRTDLRLRWRGKKAVVEVKGLTKSASERNAAQLEKWVAEEVIASGGAPKGILVANVWRTTPLSTRVQQPFPDQMIPFSKSRGHCLMTGLQLLAMVQACRTDPSLAETICDTIMDTVGVLSGWSDVTQIFESPRNSDSASTDV